MVEDDKHVAFPEPKARQWRLYYTRNKTERVFFWDEEEDVVANVGAHGVLLVREKGVLIGIYKNWHALILEDKA